MKRVLFLSIFMLAAFFGFSQAIIGGAGICFTNSNPNSVTSLDNPVDEYTCRMVVDTTNDKLYWYDGTQWAEINTTPLDNALTDGNIFVGNSSNIATDVSMSGDVSITNAGVTTLEAIQTVDINITSLTTDDVLQYNGSQWVNVQASTFDTNLTEEEVQDFAWNVLTGTQTGITVTYQDGTNDVDFVVTVQGVNDQANGLDIVLTSNLVEVSYDFTELSNIGSVDNSNDRLILYDNDGAVHGYITPNQIAGTDTNIGNTNQTLTGARTVTMAGNNLTFDGTGDVAITDAGGIVAASIPAYSSKSAADAALAAGTFWQASATNNFGAIKGTVIIAE